MIRSWGKRWLTSVVVVALGLGMAAWPGAGVALLLGRTGQAHAEQAAPGTWEMFPLPDPVYRLFAPASGALFADGTESLYRSNDGGATWAAVNLPPPSRGRSRARAIDPTDHTAIYAVGELGRYKTADDAATWQVLLPETFPTWIAVSPADRNLVYLVFWDRPDLRIMRSRDGGASWETAHERQHACDGSPDFFQPHASDPARAFLAISCAGVNPSGSLEQSADQGATWSGSGLGETTELVGGQGAAPGRFYAVHPVLGPSDPNLRGVSSMHSRRWETRVYKSDDGGQGWFEVRDISSQAGRPDDTRPIGAELAYDPAAPDRVYLAGAPPRVGGEGVLVSQDGGTTWANAGQGGPTSVNDLALGIDGRNLYAAGQDGVSRLRLE